MTDLKVGHYGKLIITDVLFVENSCIYFERLYYPTAPKCWGMPISVDNQVMYTKHYIERMIERKNVIDLKGLKSEIYSDFMDLNDNQFVEKYGRLDIDCDHIIVQRDWVSFNDYQTQPNGAGGILRKSLITKNEYKGSQEQIINHILDKLDVSVALLTTHEIPRSVSEANNVIEDTFKRTTHATNWVDQIFKSEGVKDVKRANKIYHKQLFAFLQRYDPTKSRLVPMEYN